jgi:hypothetical protein
MPHVPIYRRSRAAQYAANLSTFPSGGSLRIISVGRQRMSGRERLGLAQIQPPQLELVGGFGFAELGRFKAAYRAAFSETPLTTLQRAPGGRFINP